ncbi:MAG: hypothetical protein AW07_03571 [Candidatus Accumulibacter sp. SK-11]|nr:MAG: hypothetical protein AW07_03571 [Candidatus Accumulibacter sp. SK-11]
MIETISLFSMASGFSPLAARRSKSASWTASQASGVPRSALRVFRLTRRMSQPVSARFWAISCGARSLQTGIAPATPSVATASCIVAMTLGMTGSTVVRVSPVSAARSWAQTGRVQTSRAMLTVAFMVMILGLFRRRWRVFH